MSTDKTSGTGLEIAVIGMSCRFPGARNTEEFWTNLSNGVESISYFIDEELELSGEVPHLIRNSNYVKAKGCLTDSEYFDSGFFGYTPREAEMMDPQVRILHESSWEALEDAGYEPDTYKGLIGLYTGARSNPYWIIRAQGSMKNPSERFNVETLNDSYAMSTRISYKLNLKGPALTLQTACSSSLVAISLACKGLLNGECDMALAGGASITFPQKSGYLHQEGMVTSPDGHCRAFDEGAQGTVRGDGVGLIVLKRLEEAAADGDNIYAVVKGSAVNNDGTRKVAFTAPGIEGQVEVIRAAQYMAEIEPESITYVETHGTGTTLGDPIEIEGLKLAFNTGKKRGCRIGSVKTNIGHLDSAAGVAGIIKTILNLKNRLIPPHLHFKKPTPNIDFENTPFYVNTELTEWTNDRFPLRAGVSSFGIGGTNAHVILEEFSQLPEGTGGLAPLSNRQYQLILLSAKTKTALDRMTKNLAAYFKNSLFNQGNHENPVNPGLTLANAAYTLQVGRKDFKYRLTTVCSTVKEAIESLTSPGIGKIHTSILKHENRPVIFMFPGQGAQYINMGLDLYTNESIFRSEVNHCCKILEPIVNFNIRDILYPDERSQGHQPGQVKNNDIFPQDIIQPLVFIFEYSLARLLMRWKIQPYAMIGYSLGEYVAACLAGVFSLEEVLALVAYRGKLMQEIPGGSMLSVPLPEKKLEPLLKGHLAIAVANGPSCVVSGDEAAINRLEKQLQERKYICIRLNISHATHSMMMEPMLKAFEAKVRQIRLNTPKIPFISNPTGQWITSEDATNPKYWVNQLRKTVRFADGLKKLLRVKNAVFIEVGPGGDLCNILRSHQDKGPDQSVLNLVRYPQQKVSDVYYLLNRIGRLWLEGVKIDWPGFYKEEKRHRISLPTYPFERQKFGVGADITHIGASVRTRLGPRQSLSKKSHPEDWFYIFSWKRSGLPPDWKSEKSKDSSWLIFVDEGNLGSQLSERLVSEGREVITVKAGTEFVKVGDDEFVINPKRSNNYHELLNELKTSGKVPNRILHLWGITQSNSSELETQRINTALDLGYYSLIYLARAIGKQHFTREFKVEILTNNMQMVTGEEELCPEKATVLGTCKVIPQEYSNISCRSIDVVLPEPGTRNWQRLIENLLAELYLETPGQSIAYRGNHRWVQTFEPLRLNKSGGVPPCLRIRGVYLITGGPGNIGLALAGYLARQVKAKLILTGRSTFPLKKDWEKWLEDHDENDTTSYKIRRIRELEKSGGKVLITRANVADYKQMQKVIRRAEKKFGKINGVIHAAGVIRGFSLATTIEHIDEATCIEQFNPKIYGLPVLEKLLQNKEIDFCLFTSSLAPVLGGLGYVAYSAANLFMDTFVQRHNQTSPVPWINVNCESWIFEKKQQDNRFGATTIQLALQPGEVIEVFHRILSHREENQILVSTGDINARINQWITREPVGSEDPTAEKKSFSLHPRPNLSNPYIAPRNQNEQKLAGIWQRFFGIQSVGIFDNFFEIGGDSLKAIELVARINHELGIKLQFSELLKTQTIKLLSEQIENKYKYQTNYPPIEAVEKRDYYPATYVQKAMFMPKNSVYKCRFNLSRVYVLEGKLDLKRFERACKQLVQRHEVFRTSFHLVNGEILQKVSDTIEFKVKMVKCDEKEAKKRMKEFVKPFDLSKPPPLRIELLQVENKKNYFLFDMHHIIHDGVSEIIIMKELWTLYDGKKLEPVILQYKDYAAWQDKMFHGGILEKYETYWLDKLKDFKFTQLPADPVNCSMKLKHGVERLTIDKTMYKKMEKFCSQQKITKLTFLVAVFKLVLAKDSGYSDIAIGQRVSTRFHYKLRNTLGCFLEKVVIRSHIDNKDTFLNYVSKIDRIIIAAVDNSLYPYELLNEKIRQNNDIPGSELFNIILNYLPAEENNGHVSDSQFKISYFHIKKVSSKYHINLKIADNFENIVFIMKYRSCLYSRDRIKRMLNNFVMIAARVLSHSSIKVNDIIEEN